MDKQEDNRNSLNDLLAHPGMRGAGGTGGRPRDASKRPSPAMRIATLGVLGRSPSMPGTVGTAFAGIPAVWLCSHFHGLVQLALVLAVCLVGWRVSSLAEKELGRQDPQTVVIDELAGYMVTMLWLPLSFKSLLLGFIAFRFFDIKKPWPVNVLDKELHGGLGIMADDVAAGLYAHAVVWTILQVWP